MSDIPTWHERAMAHPDHQSGMISEDMIRARMAEEISDLRAEVERLTRERDEARAEVERLIASNKRLHHALFRIAGKAPFAYADDPWTIAAKAMKREAKP